jgi:hypothetical protein
MNVVSQRIGRQSLRFVPLKLLYGVQDALVRDSGGEVFDTGECRTDSSQRCCMACKTFCAALCMGLVAIIVLAVNKRL